MLNLRQVLLSRKKFIFAAALLAILVVLVFTVMQCNREPRVPASEFFEQALQKTTSAESFRFRISTELGDNNEVSAVTGKRVAPDRVHLKGSLQDTPVELVHIGDTTYLRETGTGKWFTLKGNKIINSELFAMELNPLGTFDFKDIDQVSYEGKEKIEGKQLVLVELRPQVSSSVWQRRYADFVYKVWIDPKSKYISKASITASGREEGDQINIGVELWDYNKQMEITPPADNNREE